MEDKSLAGDSACLNRFNRKDEKKTGRIGDYPRLNGHALKERIESLKDGEILEVYFDK